MICVLEGVGISEEVGISRQQGPGRFVELLEFNPTISDEDGLSLSLALSRALVDTG
jgi:hypothetical protein